jgi:hypothetical protein
MLHKPGSQRCPQCGNPILGENPFCGRCGQKLTMCRRCGAGNLAGSLFCHNCGEPIGTAKPAEDRGGTRLQFERMQICQSCKKVIGSSETYCSYCGAKVTVHRKEPQTSLDPRTLKVALLMVERVTTAKDHPEYAAIDQLTTVIADTVLRKNQPHDARELSFIDQLRLLTLVFEFSRDKVTYKGEIFGELVRWPWDTLKTGGDCDCKVVLLASMLASLAFRKMYFLVLAAGTYSGEKGMERKVQGHAVLEVELSDGEARIPIRLDPSCSDCDVDEMAESIRDLLPNFYRIPIIP